MRLRKLVLPAMALAVTFPLFSIATQAATNAAAASNHARAKANPADAALLKFSQVGNAAMAAIRRARFDLFEGAPKTALKQMEAANTYLGRAEKEAPEFQTTARVMVGGKLVGTTQATHEAKSVPIDGRLEVADNFALTPEKQAHIDKANAHFRKGEHAQALEELKLGEIDVNYTRSWMPLALSRKQVDEAIKLARDGKYYEANLALKAIEDSVTTDSVTLSDLPKRPAA